MPELPEMQALAERLDEYLAGADLARTTPLQFSALKSYDPPADFFLGRTLSRITRRGKYLVFDFEGPRILVHLSQGGRIDVEDPPKATRPKGAIVRFAFTGRPSILIKEFGTQRKAGWWTLAEGESGPLEKLGPEPFDPAFDSLLLEGSDSRRLHSMFRDQKTVAGIGRGYADDILHRARLSPYASLSKLKPEERQRLLETVHGVLDDALAEERKRTGGLPTKMKDRFVVHGRWGNPCPVCGAKLQRISYEDYEITYCPQCQTNGRVLADRRMSRLLR